MFTRPTARALKAERAREADAAARARALVARSDEGLVALLAECVCVTPANAQSEASLAANECRKSPRPEREVAMVWLRAHTRVAPEVGERARARAASVLDALSVDAKVRASVLAALAPRVDEWARGVAVQLIVDVCVLLRAPTKKRK